MDLKKISYLLILLFSLPVFAVESGYASLSEDGGMQGNPSALDAYGSAGAIFGYQKFDYKKDNYLFGFWGSNLGASFDWTTGKNGYDKSKWSLVHGFSNNSRSFFLGSRLSLTRISDEEENGYEWSPGFIWRPLSFTSLGFWSENALQGGFYQKRTQNVGLSLRPFNGITASWNWSYPQKEQNLLLELEAFDLTLAMEFPIVEKDDNSEFRFSLSTDFGSYNHASVDLTLDDSDNNWNFKKFNFIRRFALNQGSLEGVRMIRVPLGSISEKNNGWSLFGFMQSDLQTLRNTFTMLEKSSAKVIVFDFSDYSGGFSISQEIRRGIYSLKKRGKRVAAYTNDYRPVVIFAASAADKVILQPSSFVDFKGLANEVLYYKGLLDWAGIKVEMLRHGSYKSATEPYTLDSMSAEARANLQGILGGWWNAIRDSVAASRNLSPEFLDSLAENPRVIASAAKNNGLADTLLYIEDVPAYLYKVFTGKENQNAYMDNWYLSDEKIFNDSWQPRAKIAVLNLEGMIVGGYGSGDPLFGRSVAGVADIIDIINDIGYSGDYEALILRINSPGGSALASDELWHSLNTLKESGMPVIASVGDMAASGGYYVACAADMIVAEAGSVVGSIGIYGGKPDFSGLLAKLKVKSETVKTHESADAKSIFKGLSQSDSASLQEYMDDFYARFVGVVASGRGMSEEQADSLGGGRVYIGMDAVSNGLVDEIGGFDKALEVAREKAGLKRSARVETVHINNFGYSFADRISVMVKGDKPVYPWLKDLERTNLWALYF